MHKFSKKIRALRDEKGYTQKELASLLGISKQAVSKWENDRGLPDSSMFPVIAGVFGVSVDYLMGMEGKKAIKVMYIKKMMYLLVTILLFSLLVIAGVNIHKIEKYRSYLAETIDIEIPRNGKLNIIDLSDWQKIEEKTPFKRIIYIDFDESNESDDFKTVIEESEDWKKYDSEIAELIPYNIKSILDYGDYVILKNEDTIEELENEGHHMGRLVIVFKINKRRLIIFEY